MGSRKPDGMSSLDKLLNQFTAEMLDQFSYEPFIQPATEKKNQKKTSKNVQFWTKEQQYDSDGDSDEEFKAELEKAVKQYKKNIKNTPVRMEVNLSNKETKHDINKENQVGSGSKKNKSGKKDVSDEVYSNEKAVTDVQDLINYFFLDKKDRGEKPTVKSYVDYEKQGAIPKNKFVRDLPNGGSKSKRIDSKSEKRKNQLKIDEVLPNHDQSAINEDFIEYVKNSNCFKISEEFCSKPFYYIVPDNPRPNFFLSAGSYYVIPKIQDSAPDSRVFFHPENQTEHCVSSSEPESGTGTLRNEKKQHIPRNNLGKKAIQKMDSHLNIGPADVKLDDSNNNLETNYELNKVFHKNMLNSNGREKGVGVPGEKNGDFAEAEANSLTETGAASEEMSEIEMLKLQELDKTLQTLLMEFPNLDTKSAKAIADNYFMDEEGLKHYIDSTHLKQKIQRELEKMVEALPENSYDELRVICNEFQGDEELVDNFIRETKRANKIRQQVLDLQFVLPDADPDFLHREVEKLNGDDNAFNTLTDKLLDNEEYPKIFDSNLSAERKIWWQTHVENFNVKNFLLKVPNPGNFEGPAGDYNKTDPDLIFKFLQSRYPSETQESLRLAFNSNNCNVTKTCNYLKGLPLVRLSQSSFRFETFSEAFLEEICYIDHKKEIDDYLKEEKELKEIEVEEARLNNSFLFCPLCSEDELIASEAICCLEGHLFCKNCIKRYIFVKMGDGVFKIVCPLENCDTSFSQKALQEILAENILSKIINKQQAEEISTAKVDGLEFCPHCEFAYIPSPEDKIFKCQNPACLAETCRQCREKNHIPLRCEEIERSVDVEARKKIEESMTQELVRVCPNCQKKFVKIDGCNKMVCVCGTIVCYICRKQVEGYGHFSSYRGDGRCPLHTNNDSLHRVEVYQAGVRTREEILRENQDIRILYDPTVEQ